MNRQDRVQKAPVARAGNGRAPTLSPVMSTGDAEERTPGQWLASGGTPFSLDGGSTGTGTSAGTQPEAARLASAKARLSRRSVRLARCWYGHRGSGWRAKLCRRNTWVLAALLAIGVAASIGSSVLVQQQRETSELARARNEAANMLEGLSSSLTDYLRAIRLLAAGLHATTARDLSMPVDMERANLVMDEFVHTVEDTTTGSAYMVRVPHDLRPQWEAQMTEAYSSVPGFQNPLVIHTGNTTVPAPVADEYYAVAITRVLRASDGVMWNRPEVSGLDPTAIPGVPGRARLQAVLQCMESGEVTATEPLDIFADIGGWGYLVYARIGNSTSGYRGEKAIGVVVTAFESHKLVSTLLGITQGAVDGDVGGSNEAMLTQRQLQLVINDITDPSSEPLTLVDRWLNRPPTETEEPVILVLSDVIGFAGRDWGVTINVLASDMESLTEDGTSLMVLLGGIVATVLCLAIIVLVQAEYTRRHRLHSTQLRARVASSTHARLVAYICHELRNPLHHLSGGLRLFSEDHQLIITGRMKQELKMLSQSVAQMRHVVNDILDIRKLEAGEVEIVEEPTDMRAAVRDLTNQLRDVVTPDTSLRVVASDSLPELLMTDPMRIRQLLGNAVHNAAKFTPAGRIDVVMRTFRHDRWLLLEVRNTGIGLQGVDGNLLLGHVSSNDDDSDEPESDGTKRAARPTRPPPSPELLSEIKSWFHRSMSTDAGDEISLPESVAHRYSRFAVTRSSDDGAGTESLFSRTEGRNKQTTPDMHGPSTDTGNDVDESLNMLLNANGLGLGLPLCRRVVLYMGGAIGLEDVPGFTRWWAVVPVSPVSEEFAADNTEAGVSEEKRSEGGSTHDVETDPLHVIAVDDEVVLRRLLRRYLEKVGVRATVLDDGLPLANAIVEATEAGNPPACVFLDIVMKRSDGADVCRALRRSGVKLPIYAMTGNVDSASVQKYQNWGFNGVLAKPFTHEELATAIKHAARGARGWLSSMPLHKSRATTPASAPSISWGRHGRSTPVGQHGPESLGGAAADSAGAAADSRDVSVEITDCPAATGGDVGGSRDTA